MKKTKIIQLFTSADVRGSLSFFEEGNPIPFKIQCTYLIYNGYRKQEYVHKYGEQFVVALSGSCDIVVDDGRIKKTYILAAPSYGLYIPSLHWSIIKNFSKYSLLLIITSCKIDKIDCIYNYDEFLSLLNK